MSKVASLVFILIAVNATGCSDLCANEVQAETASPSGANRALVFTRDCGATTGWSTHISVISNRQTLPNEGGNTLVLDGKSQPRVVWKSESSILVIGASSGRTFKREVLVNGITINYE
jgi:hypothetical protein